MKILAISQVYYPDTASTAQHLSDLLEKLASRNHNVTVITSIRKYEDPKCKFSKKEIHKNVKIIRLTNTGFGKISKLSRVIDFVSFNLMIFFKLIFIRRKDYDLIIGMTSPPLLSYIGVKIAKLKKIKFVYWTMDLQPELSVVAGYIHKDSFSAKSLQKKGDYIFKNSNKIIALDSYMKNHIEQRTMMKMENIDVIPVWPVMNEIDEFARNENPFRVKYNFGNKIVIMYSGNHSVMHPITTLLEAALKLKKDDRFIFVHIGGGERIKEVKQYIDQFNLENILILPYQPRELIHLSLGSSDIQVVTLGGNCVGFTHPNKIYGAMFIGKPILYIGPKVSHITDILTHCPGNINVGHGDSEILTEKLLKYALLTENQKQEIGITNRKYAQNNFDPNLLINSMIDSIEKT